MYPSPSFFAQKPAIVGMIHLAALPGTPRHNTSLPDATARAVEEARIYLDAGVDGLMLENMHDLPYLRGEAVGPEIVAAMTRIALAVRQLAPELPIGVQVLAAANRQALAVAQAAGLNFVRVEGFVFGHLGDEGYIDASAGELLRYRRQIGAEEIEVWTDVKKKHAAHALTADVDLIETARAAAFFDSDALILTGKSTGRAASVDELQRLRSATDLPVWIGSGVSRANWRDYAAADGFIVGSHFKRAGNWANAVDKARVGELVAAVREG